MRSFILALVMGFFGSATVAQSASFAVVAPLPDTAFKGGACYWIDSTKGWQRVPWKRGSAAAIVAVDPDGRYGSSRDGWTVDDARYAKVGAAGHSGADAAALQPFEAFKLTQDLPFGALLARDAADRVYDVSKADTSVNLDAKTPYIDFRINDTGLGDNGGRLRICLKDKADL